MASRVNISYQVSEFISIPIAGISGLSGVNKALYEYYSIVIEPLDALFKPTSQ